MGDAGAVFTNPVGLATLSHLGLEASYRTAPADAFLLSGALGWRLGQFDLGVGGRLFDFGSDPAAYLGGAIPSGTDAQEALGVASLVYRFGMIALGVSGKHDRAGCERQIHPAGCGRCAHHRCEWRRRLRHSVL
jgi:hypothetical protein